MFISGPDDLNIEAWRLTGLVLWMVIWWITEAVSLQVTALLPIPLMPLLGIVDQKAVTANYAHPLIFLFMGGFMIAIGMQRWGLHKRIALNIVALMGSNPIRIVGGFMLATAFLSMWISNTATTIMMFAVGHSLIDYLQEGRMDQKKIIQFGKALMLGIAYAASIGGVGTLIGTPPNTLFASFVSNSYNQQVSFSYWMLFAVPFVLILLPLSWYWLTYRTFNIKNFTLKGVERVIGEEISSLGPMSRAEHVVLWVFMLAAFSWMTRKWLAIWTGLSLSDTTIAMSAAVVLFMVPLSLEKRQFVLDWESAVKLPWGVLLLFGGGLAIAYAFQSSGLAEAVGNIVSGLKGIDSLWIVVFVTVVVSFLTQLTSNTATTATFLPIMGAVALGLRIDPILLCVPVTLAASMAFMMPVATPPNAIVFAYKELTIRDMLKAGFVLNIIAIILIVVMIYLFGPVMITMISL